MGLGIELLSGTVKLAADWRKKGVNAQTAAGALLQLAGCAAVAAKMTDETFSSMATAALLAAKEIEK